MPPGTFDFRERTYFYGPISDVIPSSPVIEMYPAGFVTLAESPGHRIRARTRAEHRQHDRGTRHPPKPHQHGPLSS